MEEKKLNFFGWWGGGYSYLPAKTADLHYVLKSRLQSKSTTVWPRSLDPFYIVLCVQEVGTHFI